MGYDPLLDPSRTPGYDGVDATPDFTLHDAHVDYDDPDCDACKHERHDAPDPDCDRCQSDYVDSYYTFR